LLEVIKKKFNKKLNFHHETRIIYHLAYFEKWYIFIKGLIY
jgi:hypothetical protein